MSVSPFTRVIVIVLDGVGVGALPDAAAYGDQGSHTLQHVLDATAVSLPAMASLGLSHVVSVAPAKAPRGLGRAFGRMAERSPGKDSVTGHWELMGVVLPQPFPTFPQGFPEAVIDAFEQRIGRPILGNVAASGTEIIERYGDDHVRTGSPIVYTSADSVFQIAAHEEVVPLETLYAWCESAYALTVEGLGIGRVIARPFIGASGSYRRTAHRHDYAMPPRGETLLDRLDRVAVERIAIGKVRDLFAGRATGRATPTASDEEGMRLVREALTSVPSGLIFANLVDFDTQYGHRNDVAGFAANLARFDRQLGALLPELGDGDLLCITADHGNDPTTPTTDHAREHVPLLLAGRRVRPETDLGTRATFADLGQTLAEIFDVGPLAHGTSFLPAIVEREVSAT